VLKEFDQKIRQTEDLPNKEFEFREEIV